MGELQQVIRWRVTADELPPVVESFSNGMNFHGAVIGWFPYFYKHNDRDCALWTCKGVDDRWMVAGGDGYGKAKEPPTHWMPLLSAPIVSAEHG